jgi:hypothetical protein
MLWLMRTALFAAALALAAVTGCQKSDPAAGTPAAASSKEATFPEMTVDEVDHALAANQIKVVDCNMDETRKKLGVIPGAILVEETDSYPESLLPNDKTAKLVFYCAEPA